MDMSKIKRSLLKSGIPLEASVVKKFAELEFGDLGSDWREITYERNGKVFTTDIEISKSYYISKNSGFKVSLVIECKYKEKNHCWYFMEFQKGPLHYSVPPNAVFGDFIDPILKRMGYQLGDADSVPMPKLTIQKILELLKLQKEGKVFGWRRFGRMNLFDAKGADKGVDILTNKTQGDRFDPNTITRAASQAIHGAITVHAQGIDYVSLSIVRKSVQQKLHSYSSIGLMTVPIIVTTAELFRVKDGISMEDIQNTDNINDLFRRESSILLFNNKSSFRKFSGETFKEENIQSFYKAIDLLGDSSIGDNPSFRFNFPGNVYVLNYECLDDLLPLCLEKLEKLSNEIMKEYERLVD